MGKAVSSILQGPAPGAACVRPSRSPFFSDARSPAEPARHGRRDRKSRRTWCRPAASRPNGGAVPAGAGGIRMLGGTSDWSQPTARDCCCPLRPSYECPARRLLEAVRFECGGESTPIVESVCESSLRKTGTQDVGQCDEACVSATSKTDPLLLPSGLRCQVCL